MFWSFCYVATARTRSRSHTATETTLGVAWPETIRWDARDVERAARAVAGTCDGARTLRPIAQMSVSTADAHGGRTDAKEEGQ